MPDSRIDKNIPFEYGEFSFRSLGLTLNIPSSLMQLPYIAPAIISYMLAGDTPVEEKLRDLDEALRLHWDEKSQFVSQGYTTCVIHELRHFHDYLASPFGANVMAEHMLAVHYLFPLLVALHDEPTIVVPLEAWSALSEPLYRALRHQAKDKQLKRTPPADAASLATLVSDILARVRAWSKSPSAAFGVPVTTQNLVEASALEVQAFQMWSLWGAEPTSFFIESLKKLDRDRVYTRIWNIIYVLERQFGRCLSAALRNAILFYALCGAPSSDLETERERVHPVERLAALLGYVGITETVPEDDHIPDFQSEAAQALGWPTLQESMIQSVERSHKMVDALRRMRQQENRSLELDLFPETDVNAYAEWVDAHEFMVNRILRDPVSYFDPVRYFGERDQWVAAPAYVALGDSFFEEDDALTEKWLQKGWEPVWGYLSSFAEGRDPKISYNLLYGPEMTDGCEVLSRDVAKRISFSIWLSYLLASKGMLKPLHRQVGTRMLESMLKGSKVIRI